jgi:hypothetical protein
MRPQLAPLATALSIAGVMSVGAAVATHGAVNHRDRIVPAAQGDFLHDVQVTNTSHAWNADVAEEVVRPPIEPPSCPGHSSVHFDTPQAAMRYLASAWNRRDYAALCQVTNPDARYLLVNMHREAVNLRLKSCGKLMVGAYSCTFIHDYPASMHKQGHGRAWLDVAPARNPGWYMTVFEGCG